MSEPATNGSASLVLYFDIASHLYVHIELMGELLQFYFRLMRKTLMAARFRTSGSEFHQVSLSVFPYYQRIYVAVVSFSSFRTFPG